MQSQKHSVNQAGAGTAAMAGAGFGSTLNTTDLFAMERKARQERAAIVGGWIRERLARAIASLRAAHRRRVAMAELNALDNRMLADIGISRSEISGVVASASGYTPRTVRTPAAASSLNDDALSHAA